ncbi:RteC domain-containing protein [Rufibacter sp. LB8]|uniref:RteC domain-containing protein n=1 Tax=Rufibacter sp. LB8 TaxID=2777781 RepID=UPI00178C16D3|nr:RteC domain-containing protein [Rufibacter sp. LB8]
MKQFTETMYEDLLSDIDQMEQRADLTPAMRRLNILDLLHQRLEELKAQVLAQGFASQEEEIHFFKHQKPRIAGLLVYHARVDMLELMRPEGSLQDIRCFFENELAAIRWFHHLNLPLYQYYRSEATYLDEKLFLRGGEGIVGWHKLLEAESDDRFCTPAGNLLARMVAHGKLTEFLHRQLQLLENNRGANSFPPHRGKQLTWTGDAINLVEIAYGWYCTGQLNHGQAGIAEIVRWLEEHLNISIGRPYRRFTEIKRRKLLSQTKYLDQMRESLLKKLDEEDAFDPRRRGPGR